MIDYEKEKTIFITTELFIYLLLAIAVHFLFPIGHIGNKYQLVGTILIILGVTINIWTDSLFKRNKTTVKPGQTPTHLITQGPFRFSRHPMYLGFVIILLGAALFLGSISSFIAPILMFVILERKLIPYEEKQMENRFRKEYLEYKKRVRRWL